ncbi:Phage late-transcription coactivator [uncultured Caudovirales phage]|uniref:Phage late-transcription coactivator n=1 Tax=uncultured Caudovirales phage TaxID=2100421 RepID=A0A6J5L1M0_9CAUD|nr:Phage late-transcription coactivator [uncultured Caudovirales phage]
MFETASDFSLFIETTAKERNVGVVDIILEYCEDNYIEPEEISKLINKSLRDKLEMNFVNMNYLPKAASLEI